MEKCNCSSQVIERINKNLSNVFVETTLIVTVPKGNKYQTQIGYCDLHRTCFYIGYSQILPLTEDEELIKRISNYKLTDD